MYGVYRFLSFLAIYYVFVSAIDMYGTIKSYRGARLDQELPEEKRSLKFDFNTDLFAVCVIYLVSYFVGVFS